MINTELDVTHEYVVEVDGQPFNHSYSDFSSALGKAQDLKEEIPESKEIIIYGQFNLWQDGDVETIDVVEVYKL